MEKVLGPSLVWSDELRNMADGLRCADVLANESRIFDSRRDALRGQLSLIETQIAQL